MEGSILYKRKLGNKYELLDVEDTPMQQETLVADSGVPPRPEPNVNLTRRLDVGCLRTERSSSASVSLLLHHHEHPQHSPAFQDSLGGLHSGNGRFARCICHHRGGFPTSPTTEEEDMSTTIFGPPQASITLQKSRYSKRCRRVLRKSFPYFRPGCGL
jgi:hypothetical protein